MTNYVMHRIHSFANRIGVPVRGARVLCLGAAFKAGVSDVRNSRVVKIMELLGVEGATVEYCDPLVTSLSLHGVDHKAVDLEDPPFVDFDLVVVLVRNAAWPVEAVLASGVPTFDAVNALGARPGPRHERL